MLHLLLRGSRLRAALGDSASDLLRSTVRILLYACIGLALILQIGLSATWPLRFGWNLLQSTLAAVLTCLLSLRLMRRNLILSQALWQVGMAAAIVMAALSFRRGEVLFLLALLPMLATIVLGWQGGVLSEILIVGLLVWLTRHPALIALPQGYGAGIVLGGALEGFVGWAVTRALITTTEWSLHSYKQAEQSLMQVRDHRQQLARVVKSLDQAYHQLERSNASLVAAWQAAREAERIKAQFVASVSHELRTPLNLIIGYSEVMVTSPESYRGARLPSAYRRDITAIYNSARHLMALVDDVLDLGRIDADRVALARDEVDPASLVSEVEELVQDYVAAKGLELRLAIADELPRLRVDRLRIRQVLLNLVVNAARFTERGYIRMEVCRRDDEVVFEVEDTGRGIDPGDLPHVFEPFHIAGAGADSDWHSGSGLGLPISKKLVELHGGWIDVQSTVNQGTTFTVYLPCRPRAERIRPPSPSTAAPAQPAHEREQVVVVVPDDPLVLSQLERHLEGFRFVSARNMPEGLAVAEEVQATAIVMSGDGDEMVTDSGSHVLVVSLPWPSSARIAAGLGASDFLVKPVSRQQLFTAIDRLDRPVKRVLIVDDDPELVSLFRRLLRARFPVRDCLEAYSGEEALQRLRADRPDVVLLDLSMPGMDGQTVIERMSSDPDLAGIPVIVVSGVAWQELQQDLVEQFRVVKTGGFRLGEATQTLRGILEATTTDWGPPDPVRAASARAPSE